MGGWIMVSERYRKKFRAAVVILSFCVCAGVIMYARERLGGAVAVSAPAENAQMLILDGGHGGYALSIVI